jgi:hypothetical protein
VRVVELAEWLPRAVDGRSATASVTECLFFAIALDWPVPSDAAEPAREEANAVDEKPSAAITVTGTRMRRAKSMISPFGPPPRRPLHLDDA